MGHAIDLAVDRRVLLRRLEQRRMNRLASILERSSGL